MLSTSDSALLRRPAAVVGDRRDVRDARDLQAAVVERPYRGLAPGARTADTHLDVLDAVLLGRHACLLRRDLGGERRALAGAAEAAAACRRPGQRIALAIGDRDDGVVEGRMHVRDRVEHVLARLLGLLGASARPGRGGTALLLLLISHYVLMRCAQVLTGLAKANPVRIAAQSAEKKVDDIMPCPAVR